MPVSKGDWGRRITPPEATHSQHDREQDRERPIIVPKRGVQIELSIDIRGGRATVHNGAKKR